MIPIDTNSNAQEQSYPHLCILLNITISQEHSMFNCYNQLYNIETNKK